MKILIVIPSFLNGGTNTCLRSLLPILVEHDFKIDVFAITNIGPNREYAAKFANILGVGGESSSETKGKNLINGIARYVKKTKKILSKIGIDISPIIFKRVATKLERQNYDLIISYQEGITTHFCSHFMHTPKIAWVHCDYERHVKDIGGKSENNLYKGFNKVICVSEYTKRKFLNCINSCNSVVALHNITDDKLIIERSKQPIDDDRFDFNGLRIVSVGRINIVKRFGEIPFIASKLKNLGLKDFRWYIIGEGDSDETMALENNIEKYNTPEVILLGNKNNPYPYIDRADLFVSTSITEACPCVLNEAKILHTPIIATDFGSVYEFIIDGEDGLISPIETIDKKIYSFFTDKSLFEHIIQNIKLYESENVGIVDKLVNEILVI